MASQHQGLSANAHLEMAAQNMEIEARIDYWSESVLCFDPEKVVAKLVQLFPDLNVDPMDWAAYEVQRVARWLQASDADSATRDTMLRQIQGKARRNGPVLNFRLETDDGCLLKGQASRYSVSVRSERSISEPYRTIIVDLFTSLGAGEITIDDGDGGGQA